MNRSILLSLLGLLLISTAAAQTTHTVTLSGTSFTPADLTIEAGDTVLWDNVSGIHSVNGTTEAYPDNPEGFTSGAPAAAPWQYEFTFNTPGDYGYHCDVHGGPGFGMRGHVTVVPATTDSPLIISEYVEGSSFNKAIELYNPSDSPVDLAAGSYTVQLFYNGNPDPGDTIALTGTVEPGGVFVLAEDSADPAILAVADQLSGSLVFSGDDAVVLFQGAAVVDVIGQVGFDPGAQWGTGDTSTADNTLRREGDACTPDTDPSDEFDPAASYTGYPIDTFDGLGNPGDLACGGGTECDLKYLNADLTYNAGTRRLCATVTVRNNGDAPRTARLVLDYNRNGGPPQGSKTLGSGTLPGGAQATRTICLRVPGNAPDGDYNFDLRLVDVATGSDCGSYTETIAISAPRVGDAAVGGDFEVEAVADLSPAADAAAPATARAMVTASPNPAREGATLHYTLPAAADVRLAVYDALGREVAVLAEGRAEAGAHAAVLDARALPAGVYVYRLTVDGRTEAGRLTVVE